MSLGSLSQEAHENLAIAMNRIGKSNSGEVKIQNVSKKK
jgi:glutamate synthase (ferredoxin)